ncbi:hypothetical protein Scep_014169 [Stephania cephalantha]|uniref:Nuclear transcription factor Y subunit n=1 Tax=Stephania cephalantha TaxID=152367 RepID=A0AAP0J0T7_9MAGN
MSSKPDNINPSEADGQSIPPSVVGSQPWWRVVGYNAAPSIMLGEKASKPSLELAAGSVEAKSQDVGLDEGTSISKEMQTTVGPQTDGNYGHEHHSLQHATSTTPTAGGDYLVPHTQLELVGHSIACAPYPYSDSYYGGLMTAYGTQALVTPHLLGMPHSRMPLPLEMTEEPVYVNAKQYHGILRRRQSRAKAELEKKLIKVRKPYLHESRHQHAMRRARGCGGRFLNTKKLNDAGNLTTEMGTDTDAGTKSTSPSITKVPSAASFDKNQVSFNGQERLKGHRRDSDVSHAYSNGNSNSDNCYQRQQGFRLSAYHPITGERGDEGVCSGQQRSSMSVSRPPHRALAIQ